MSTEFVIWDSTCENWDLFCHLWNDCVKIIEEISGGGSKVPEDTLESYNALEKKKKKKIIKVIVFLKGETFEEEKEVEDYTVDISDIELLIKKYNDINNTEVM